MSNENKKKSSKKNSRVNQWIKRVNHLDNHKFWNRIRNAHLIQGAVEIPEAHLEYFQKRDEKFLSILSADGCTAEDFNYFDDKYKRTYEELYVWFIKHAGASLSKLRKELQVDIDLNSIFFVFLELDYSEMIEFYDQGNRSILTDKIYASSFQKGHTISRKNLIVLDCPIYIVAIIARDLVKFKMVKSLVNAYKLMADNFKTPRREFSWENLQSVVSTYGIDGLQMRSADYKTLIERLYKIVRKTLKNRYLI